jgi:Na+/proline symporter
MELYIYLGIYALLMIGISIFIGRKNTDEDFLIAGRNRK